MSESLNVWHGQRLVGELWRDATGTIGFRYGEQWLAESRLAISISLPLTDEPFAPEDPTAHRFFANLLPEGRARELVVGDLLIPDTDFDLLRAIGGDCAGALSILETDGKPGTSADYELLDTEALASLILSKGQIHTRRDQLGRLPRLSLAGAQQKCPVMLQNDEFYLPRGQAASTHIMKFATRDYRHVPAYEAALTSLANRIGLNACNVQFRYLDVDDYKHDYLVIERYDRRVTRSGDVLRLHQEDFCQALGRGREHKYEENNGASLADCHRLILEHSSQPAPDTEHLLRWHVFNYLAGNSDGHAKNLSLLYHEDGTIRLAPIYDLVCTRAIDRIEEKLAFATGGERAPGDIRREHWERQADTLKIRSRFLLELVAETAGRIQDEIRSVCDEFQDRHGDYPALQRVIQVTEKQCRRARESLRA